jgi:hypothetical protein
MESSNLGIEKDALHDWVEDETRALDVVASWETLCDVYRTLEFNDPLSDAMRMEEYKWIIGEMNKHLSRARKKLLSCTDPMSMREALANMFVSTEAKVSNRMDLTYHKLRQMWVSRMIAQLDMMMETTKEEQEDGRTDFWNE